MTGTVRTRRPADARIAGEACDCRIGTETVCDADRRACVCGREKRSVFLGGWLEDSCWGRDVLAQLPATEVRAPHDCTHCGAESSGLNDCAETMDVMEMAARRRCCWGSRSIDFIFCGVAGCCLFSLAAATVRLSKWSGRCNGDYDVDEAIGVRWTRWRGRPGRRQWASEVRVEVELKRPSSNPSRGISQSRLRNQAAPRQVSGIKCAALGRFGDGGIGDQSIPRLGLKLRSRQFSCLWADKYNLRVAFAFSNYIFILDGNCLGVNEMCGFVVDLLPMPVLILPFILRLLVQPCPQYSIIF